MSRKERPHWERLDLELSSHVEDRMIVRCFCEVDRTRRTRTGDHRDHRLQGDRRVKRISLKVTYRRGRPIAAYVSLPRQPDDRVASTERIDGAVLVDRAADGRATGVEITDPSQCGPDRLLDLLRSLGQADIDRDDLRPLAAA
jgi:uncharacterized protein YuzE